MIFGGCAGRQKRELHIAHCPCVKKVSGEITLNIRITFHLMREEVRVGNERGFILGRGRKGKEKDHTVFPNPTSNGVNETLEFASLHGGRGRV